MKMQISAKDMLRIATDAELAERAWLKYEGNDEKERERLRDILDVAQARVRAALQVAGRAAA